MRIICLMFFDNEHFSYKPCENIHNTTDVNYLNQDVIMQMSVTIDIVYLIFFLKCPSLKSLYEYISCFLTFLEIIALGT